MNTYINKLLHGLESTLIDYTNSPYAKCLNTVNQFAHLSADVDLSYRGCP